MYGLTMSIRPTGGLTFRRMPGSMVHIATYPFLPPTTMSGWLRRLVIMAESGDYPNTAVHDPDYLALSPDYYVLGAYPRPFHAQRIHATKRHGPMYQSKHAVFSRLHRSKADEGNYEKLQLHTWEYLLADYMIGFVLHEDPDALESLRRPLNYGCKIGKEGFAYLEDVSTVRAFTRQTIVAQPATLLPGTDMIGRQGTLFPLYRYQYGSAAVPGTALSQPMPSAIEGFTPLWVGWTDEAIELDYWTDGETYVPASLVEALYG